MPGGPMGMMRGGPRVVRQIAQPTTLGGPNRRSLAWKPWQAPPVPAGYYNPTLDAELGAAQRGTTDTTADTLTALTRNTTDYNLGREGFERSEGEGLRDIATARSQDQQDAQQTLAKISEAFKRLGTTQEEQQNAAGVLSGGAALQAAAKRATNQGLQEAPVKQSEERALADLAQKEATLKGNTERSLGDLALHSGAISPQVLRLVGELDNPHARAHAQAELAKLESTPGQAGILGGRTSQDAITKLVRALRENQQFGINVQAQKAREAEGLGYVPPASPQQEHRTASGQVYRTIRRGNQYWDVTPRGQVIKRRPV